MNKNNAWLFPYNCNKYDIVGSFIKNGYVDYGTNLKNISKGDDVYIYAGAPYSALLFKCSVIDIICKSEITNDSEFKSNDDKIIEKNNYIRLKPMKNYLNKKDKVSYDALINNGVKVVKSQSNMTKEVIDYIESI